jgi:hypothetical protein
MSNQTDQIQQPTTVTRDQHAPLTVQEDRSIEEDKHPKTKKQHQTAVYMQDWWERLPVSRKTAAIGLVVLALIAIAPSSGKPVVEFLVTAALALFVALIALNQYYISNVSGS